MGWERLPCVPGVVQAHSNPDTGISDQVTLMQEPRQLLVLHLPWCHQHKLTEPVLGLQEVGTPLWLLGLLRQTGECGGVSWEQGCPFLCVVHALSTPRLHNHCCA